MSDPRTTHLPVWSARALSKARVGTLAAALALPGVLAGALAIRLWAFGGVSLGWLDDDGRYVAVAQNLANGHLPEGDAEWFGTRIVFLWPVALLFRVAGASDYTAVAWPLVGSLVAVAAAYLLGRDLVSRRVGLVAATLVAAAPLEVLLATRLRPDAIVPGLIALAVWCAVRARRSERAWAWALGAGALLGAGWSARESALLLAPVVVYALWPVLTRRPRSGAWAALLGGLLVLPALAVVTFAALAGDPLAPLTAAGEASSVRDPLAAVSLDESYLGQLWRGALDLDALLFLVLPAVAVAGVALFLRADRRAILPAAWLGWAAVYLELGTLANLDKPVRYLTLASVPAALLVAVAVDGRWAVLAPVGLVAVAVLVLAPVPGREGRRTDVVLANRVVDRLRDLPPGPVIAESYTWWAKARAYLASERLPVPRAVDPAFLDAAGRAERRALEPLPRVAGAAGGYVVVGPVRPRADWPSNWGLVRRAIRSEVPFDRLVSVARIGEATIYRWPAP